MFKQLLASLNILVVKKQIYSSFETVLTNLHPNTQHLKLKKGFFSFRC
ncbi:hypothetical protein BDD43_4008 [Mucilaginibacter gracilis]|uniref:Uncharacterized protein n=1 Tax=Mucilaginibacter gracilis TaxID=423350 RepID=A0A495J5Z5_9SPHI|nr:hypothetical protein BDD43_4008 [Mucilaginibacter gracilis]